MSRRSPSLLLALAGAAALAVAACGGSNAPALTDPTDILVKSVEAVQDAKTVHVKADLAGEVPLDLAGGLLGGGGGASPGTGGSLDIEGTTVEGDLDIEAEALQLAFKAPALLGLSGEVIAVDEAMYLKVSLLGDKYLKMDQSDDGASPSPDSSAAPTASADMLQDLRDEIGKLETPPVKLADEQCGDQTCYRVQVKLDAEDATPLASLAPGATGSGTLDVWVRKNDLRPAQIVFTGDAASGTDAANLTATVVFSDWDAAVDIQAPPADQVTEGDGLPDLLPGGMPSIPPGLFPSPSP